MKYTPQEFQKLWNESESIKELMKTTGFTNGTLRTIAANLRSVGFDMKMRNRKATRERKPTIQGKP